MRVLHLLPYLELGGTERAVFIYAKPFPSGNPKFWRLMALVRRPSRGQGYFCPEEGV
jgi:hypothetical protein